MIEQKLTMDGVVGRREYIFLPGSIKCYSL